MIHLSVLILYWLLHEGCLLRKLNNENVKNNSNHLSCQLISLAISVLTHLVETCLLGKIGSYSDNLFTSGKKIITHIMKQGQGERRNHQIVIPPSLSPSFFLSFAQRTDRYQFIPPQAPINLFTGCKERNPSFFSICLSLPHTFLVIVAFLLPICLSKNHKR